MILVTEEGRRESTRASIVARIAIRPLWIACGCLALLLLSLPLVLSPDGKTHGDWQQFLGRFHPAAVHLPIGLLMLVPVLELAGRFRAGLRDAAGFVLALSLLACAGAAALGMLLAHGGGFAHDAVRAHMWAGICLGIGTTACFLLRPAWTAGENAWLYPACLAGVLLLTAWTGHQGGSLTYGKSYLTEFAPPFVKALGPHKTYPPVDPASVYATRVQPILDANCLSCHSGSKIKGGLQLDSFAHLMDGGSSGDVVKAGHPEQSLIVQRMTLPIDHPKFMPAEGKPLAAKDIRTIQSWIQQGASPSATMLAGVEVTNLHSSDPLPQVGDYSGLKSQIEQVQRTMGIRLEQVSAKPADGLVLRTIDVAQRFGDRQLESLQPFAPFIVDVELGHTKVTDASIGTLASFSNVRSIHLEDTAITGVNLDKLAALPQLRYLNLSSTHVTQQALAGIESVKTLQHVYAFDTPAQPVKISAP